MELMLSKTAFVPNIKDKVCTSVKSESSFSSEPLIGLHGVRKNNFIVVLANICAVALPIPLVAPVTKAVLVMIFFCFDSEVAELDTIPRLHHSPCFRSKWQSQSSLSNSNSTAFIND
jgi:hypothetical protein